MSNTTKMLGGWGWVAALVLGLIPGLHLLKLAGVVCVFIAMWRAADEVRQPEVKNQVIAAAVLSVVAVAIFIVFAGASLISFAMSYVHHGFGAAGLGLGMVLGGLLAWACYIVAAWFWYLACGLVSEGAGVPTLKTGGLLGFIGAITAVVGVGFLIALAGGIMQAIAFFTAPEIKPTQPATGG